MNKQKQIEIDIDENLSRFYPNVELFNEGESTIMYEVKSNDIGLSHSDLDHFRKKGLRLFALYLTNPKDEKSQCSMRFYRKLSKKDLQR